MTRAYRKVELTSNGLWGVDIYFGAQLVRRSYYATRASASDADCADGPGDRGCIALTREGAGYRDATLARIRVKLEDCLTRAWQLRGWRGADSEYEYTAEDLESVRDAVDCSRAEIDEAIRQNEDRPRRTRS